MFGVQGLGSSVGSSVWGLPCLADTRPRLHDGARTDRRLDRGTPGPVLDRGVPYRVEVLLLGVGGDGGLAGREGSSLLPQLHNSPGVAGVAQERGILSAVDGGSGEGPRARSGARSGASSRLNSGRFESLG